MHSADNNISHISSLVMPASLYVDDRLRYVDVFQYPQQDLQLVPLRFFCSSWSFGPNGVIPAAESFEKSLDGFSIEIVAIGI
jgi:hypothetical protein